MSWGGDFCSISRVREGPQNFFIRNDYAGPEPAWRVLPVPWPLLRSPALDWAAILEQAGIGELPGYREASAAAVASQQEKLRQLDQQIRDANTKADTRLAGAAARATKRRRR